MDFWRWLLHQRSHMKLILIVHFVKKAHQTVLQNPAVFCPTFFGAALSLISLFFTSFSRYSVLAKVLFHAIYSIYPPSRPPSPPPPMSPAWFPNLVFCGMRTKQEETTINCCKAQLVPVCAQPVF